LKDKNIDYHYLDIYHGQTFTATDEKNIVDFNIPLDPDRQDQPDSKVIFIHRCRNLQKTFAYLGPCLAFISVLILPSLLIIGLFVIHLLLFTIFRRLAILHRPKSYGTVLDLRTHRSISRAVVRLFDAKYNKLLASQVSSGNGRYNFLVGPNVYYLTSSKKSYELYQSPTLDYTQTEDTVVDKDVVMRRKGRDKKMEG